MKRIAEAVETNELCKYGCGQVAKYRNGQGNLMCCKSSNSCPENKRKNSEKLKAAYDSGKRKSGIERYNSIPQETKDQMAWSRGKIFTDVNFTIGKVGKHKETLLEERGHQCESCENSEWLGKPITLELEHIDGDNQNNTRENLKLLCPNCHSQTETWKGKNKNTKNRFVSDEEFINALQTTKNVRQALLKLNLTAKAANYERAYKLLYAPVTQ